VLLGYHHFCGRLLRQFEAGADRRSHVWYRWFNELPVLVLTAVVILVVLKPF
jgi:putative membrane protein